MHAVDDRFVLSIVYRSTFLKRDSPFHVLNYQMEMRFTIRYLREIDQVVGCWWDLGMRLKRPTCIEHRKYLHTSPMEGYWKFQGGEEGGGGGVSKNKALKEKYEHLRTIGISRGVGLFLRGGGRGKPK